MGDRHGLLVGSLPQQVLGGRPLTHLTELSRYVYETANLNHRNNQPFVGQSAFAHKGGMHVHAIARATSSYEHMDPAAVGNERRILVSELSGRSNITALTAKHKLADDKALMDAILKQVTEIVTAYLSKNVLPPEDVPGLIRSVHATLGVACAEASARWPIHATTKPSPTSVPAAARRTCIPLTTPQSRTFTC